MSDTMTLEELPQFLDGIANVMVKPRVSDAIKRTADYMAGELGRGFQSSISPSREPWEALKRPRSKGHNPGTRPLIDTGDLMLGTISDGFGHIEEVADDSLRFGTSSRQVGNWNLGRIHQEGAPRANIPARPFVGWTKGGIDYAVVAIADGLMGRVEEL